MTISTPVEQPTAVTVDGALHSSRIELISTGKIINEVVAIMLRFRFLDQNNLVSFRYGSSMLTTILPGLRDLRTPLATGYLWLVAMFMLILGGVLPTREGGLPFVRELYTLSDGVGATAMLGVLTFVAYLIGSVLTVENIAPKVKAGSKIGSIALHFIPGMILTRLTTKNPVRRQLYEVIEIELSRAKQRTVSSDYIELIKSISPSYLQDQVILERNAPRLVQEQIEFESSVVENVIHNDKLALWDDFDRERSEAEFRLSVTAPLTIIVATFYIKYVAPGADLSKWLAATGVLVLGLLGIAVLYYRGLKRFVKSREIIQMAVVLDPSRAPILEKFRKLPRG
ncbi:MULTISPECIES: hypothetical protein [unclassified Rhodococcus (in: high G+C Gram-positive bacteria)]|uniref:hypothetical protein n=1 Tax=unclassified Rhodococcus (in: high G+C Gram-positive bacteria) TaxID=192944 RepID=UPI0022B3B1D5|nr:MULTISPECIES: hypothetical protein [unclassified Rhodococcus (in: high G+C Gram-positive bacteria)]MDI9919347.1 hypothetical protein [Rhodococcus sp. IEGM 1372]MDV8032280.1 hypothetical protein [Rhodococcus sp. IEGM 1414]